LELALVVGTVVATRKEPRLEGFKILLTQLASPEGKADGAAVIALDSVGAGVGELVLLVRGSSARLACELENFPVDAVILGIVDRVTAGGQTVFLKDGGREAG
jgi:ethanolamine utilization protein EutN